MSQTSLKDSLSILREMFCIRDALESDIPVIKGYTDKIQFHLI